LFNSVFATQVTEEQRGALISYIAHLSTEDWSALAYDLQALGFIPKDVSCAMVACLSVCGLHWHTTCKLWASSPVRKLCDGGMLERVWSALA